MKTLIVYDSVFGNTEKIAAAMGDAIGARVLRVSDTSPEDVRSAELLIVGSPTRAFKPMPSVTSFVNSHAKGSFKGVRVAAFDTRSSIEKVDSALLRRMMKMFGYAADQIAKRLARNGGTMAVKPAGFVVTDTEGPLSDGELERAEQWAKTAAADSAR